MEYKTENEFNSRACARAQTIENDKVNDLDIASAMAKTECSKNNNKKKLKKKKAKS